MDRTHAAVARTRTRPLSTRSSRRQLLQGGAALAGLGLLSGCGMLPSLGMGQGPRRIGTLAVDNPITLGWMDSWKQRLAELGHVDGQDVIIEKRIAPDNEGFPALVAELMALKVDVFMAAGWYAMDAARRATSTIPIVGVSSDPVGTKLVSSFQRPGGNITGLTTLSVDLAQKRVQIFKETIPGLQTLGVVWNSKTPDRQAEFDETEKGAQTVGLKLVSLEVQRQEDFEQAFKDASQAGVQGMILLFDQMTLHQAPAPIPGVGADEEPLAVFMKKYRIPAVCDVREWARHGGGLATYGPDFNGLFAKAADVTDKILAGTKPADIPIEAPSGFPFTINLDVADDMGLTIPPSALALADELVRK